MTNIAKAEWRSGEFIIQFKWKLNKLAAVPHFEWQWTFSSGRSYTYIYTLSSFQQHQVRIQIAFKGLLIDFRAKRFVRGENNRWEDISRFLNQWEQMLASRIIVCLQCGLTETTSPPTFPPPRTACPITQPGVPQSDQYSAIEGAAGPRWPAENRYISQIHNTRHGSFSEMVCI